MYPFRKSLFFLLALISAESRYGFSMAMAIICLILKPIFIIININLARQKDGQSALGPSFGDWSTANANNSNNVETQYGGLGGQQTSRHGYQQQQN